MPSIRSMVSIDSIRRPSPLFVSTAKSNEVLDSLPVAQIARELFGSQKRRLPVVHRGPPLIGIR
jgi:hypothetical protein